MPFVEAVLAGERVRPTHALVLGLKLGKVHDVLLDSLVLPGNTRVVRVAVLGCEIITVYMINANWVLLKQPCLKPLCDWVSMGIRGENAPGMLGVDFNSLLFLADRLDVPDHFLLGHPLDVLFGNHGD